MQLQIICQPLTTSQALFDMLSFLNRPNYPLNRLEFRLKLDKRLTNICKATLNGRMQCGEQLVDRSLRRRTVAFCREITSPSAICHHCSGANKRACVSQRLVTCDAPMCLFWYFPIRRKIQRAQAEGEPHGGLLRRWALLGPPSRNSNVRALGARIRPEVTSGRSPQLHWRVQR